MERTRCRRILNADVKQYFQYLGKDCRVIKSDFRTQPGYSYRTGSY